MNKRPPFWTPSTVRLQGDGYVERALSPSYSYPALPFASNCDPSSENYVPEAEPFYSYNSAHTPIALQPHPAKPKPGDQYPNFAAWIADVKANGGGFVDEAWHFDVPGNPVKKDDCRDQCRNMVIYCSGCITIPLVNKTVVKEGDTVQFYTDPGRGTMSPIWGEIVGPGVGFSIIDHPRVSDAGCATDCVTAKFNFCKCTPA